MNAKIAKAIRGNRVHRNVENYRVYLPRNVRKSDQAVMPIVLDPTCMRAQYKQMKKAFKLI